MYGNILQTRKGEWRFLTSLSRKPRKIRTFARRKPIRPIKQKMENTPNVFYMVAYKLYAIAPDGTKTLREEATLVRPYQFITGVGLVLEAFENRIKALRQGQKFDFTLSKDEAYGDRDEESVLDLPRSTFEVDGRFDKEQIYDGAIIPLQDSEGHRFPATVVTSLEQDGNIVAGASVPSIFQSSTESVPVSFSALVPVTSAPTTLQVAGQGADYLANSFTLSLNRLGDVPAA